jgi:hypothetical protein
MVCIIGGMSVLCVDVLSGTIEELNPTSSSQESNSMELGVVAKLKLECTNPQAEIYAITCQKIGKHPDLGFPKNWDNCFYPWLLPNTRKGYLLGTVPIEKDLPVGDYLIAFCLSIDQNDPNFKIIEVGHGAFWAGKGEEFEYITETFGLRMSKNGQRFAPKAISDQCDPFQSDDYVSIYVQHLGTEIKYFRIYKVAVTTNKTTSVSFNTNKTKELPKSEPTGAKGVLRGFTAEVPIYQ